MSSKNLHSLAWLSLLVATILMVNIQTIQSQTLAFPGAEGFAKYTTGGRGGEVYHVTNLNDSGAGSFRDAVSQSNRIVVFDVGGVINISSRIVISSNVTIAGQTAPGGGITIYGNGIALNGDSGNNIIRYIRIRMGKNGDSGKDAVGISEGTDYMFDHVSISWGRDGTLDVNGTGVDNLTFQDCIIGQGINNSNHSTGGLMQSGKWSIIRSLYIDNKTRNPKARGTHEFINSVLYNWGTNGYIMGDTEGTSECNLIGNYFIYGPSSSSNTHITGTTPTFYVYAEDNWLDSDKDGVLDGALLTDYKTATVMSSPYNYPGVNNQLSAQDALNHVINNVGASMVRDAVDDLLIDQVTSYGTSGAIILTEDDNGIPNNVGTVAGGTTPTDTDQDGMPDSWESSNGTDPYTADHNGDINGNGYTNIEEYLEWIIGNDIPEETTLTKHGAGSSSQTVMLTESIVDFYYSWTNASGVYVNGLPSGVNASIDSNNQTVSISGTPTTVGTYYYTITTTGGIEDIAANGIITVTADDGSVTIQENTIGFCSVDGTIDNNNDGYTGDGFANGDNAVGMGIDWKVIFETSGSHTFTFRYATSSDRPANLIVNGSTVASNIAFASTGSFTTWGSQTVTVNANAGAYTVRLEATSASGLGNIDYMKVSNASAASCTGVTYNLSTSVNGSGSVSPSSGTYEEGSPVTLTATAASGWSFSGWSGDASGSTNPLTITMNGNKTITATFTEDIVYYSLTTNTNGSGTVSPSSGTYQDGASVTLTATAASGWSFSGWSGDASGNTNPLTVTMNSNKSITATFTQDIVNYSLTTNTNGSGTVSPSSGTYQDGTSTTLTATAASGWIFNGWSGDASGNTNPLSITMDNNKTITATFTEDSPEPTITIEENETGFCSVDGTIDSNNAGYTGTGFANTSNASGNGINWYFMGDGGSYTITWRYANGGTTDRPGNLIINGSTLTSVSFPTTGGWTTWATASTTINLSSGIYDVRLEATTTSGLGNIDNMMVSGPGATIVECGYVVLNPAELTKHGAGSSIQTVDVSTPISEFYYSWVNASTATATGLPNGISAYVDNTAQTITINGTPIEVGTFMFTVTTSGGNPDASIGGTITVNSITETITIEENETGFCSVDGTVDSNNAGYIGSGFANTSNAIDNGITWSVDVASAGNCTFSFRYANGSTTDRAGDLLIDGSTAVTAVNFAGTGSWTTWASSGDITTYLSAGTHLIRLVAITSSGLSNIDNISVTGSSPVAVSCSGLKKATLNIGEPEEDMKATLSPNPASNEITISMHEAHSNVQISIFNGTGLLALQKSFAPNDNNGLKGTINISELSRGVYYVLIQTESSSETIKLICK